MRSLFKASGAGRALLPRSSARLRLPARATLALLLLAWSPAQAAKVKRFSQMVGKVKVGAVKGGPLQVPYITWGGDMATFYANGGKTTKRGSLYDRQGLKLNLVAGDDFVQQVRDYLSGKSPFLRGTYRMMGQASELIAADKRTQGVMIMQMTWSAGDHLVARSGLKTIADLKGKTIVLQQGGPHVGMLDDVLASAGLGWDDVKVVWAKELTASPNSPAEMMRKQRNIDAAFVITPDMIGLTGGGEATGTGAEGTIKGARVLVSTAQLSRSIADVYVVRKDYYDANKDTVERFVAGYLRGVEEVIDHKAAFEKSGSKPYQALLGLTQEIYGKEVIPTADDAHGLLSDCTFAGHPGNVAFFTGEGNMHGFDEFNRASTELAVRLGYAKSKKPIRKNDLNWQSQTFTGLLKKMDASAGAGFRAEAVQQEIEALTAGGGIDDNTIYSFTINFDPNQTEFSSQRYAKEFDKVVRLADKYGNAVVAIRGHSDPTKTLLELVKAGQKKGALKRTGSSGNYKYYLNGRVLDLKSVDGVQRAIRSGAFDGVAQYNPRRTMSAALNLSRKRAEAVRGSITKYARRKRLKLDPSQIQPQGVGIREPVLPKPRSLAEARENMRVEFRLVRVSAEVVNKSDFDF